MVQFVPQHPRKALLRWSNHSVHYSAQPQIRYSKMLMLILPLLLHCGSVVIPSKTLFMCLHWFCFMLNLAAITSKSQTYLQLPPYVQYLSHPEGIFMIYLHIKYYIPRHKQQILNIKISCIIFLVQSTLKSHKYENQKLYLNVQITVTARSKAWVCSRSPAETAGSNPAVSMDVCLL
jgi:hypothetical protein